MYVYISYNNILIAMCHLAIHKNVEVDIAIVANYKIIIDHILVAGMGINGSCS